MAVNYANAELGGIDGHPIQLVTCFIASAEEEGTTCAQKFLANNKIDVIDMGGVAIGVQSFYSTLNGAKPVIGGVAGTPVDGVQKNTVILFGDINHVLPPIGTYARDVLHAKTAAIVYPSDNAGIAAGAAQVKQGLQAAGVTVKSVGYPESQTDLTSVLTAAGAQTADMVVPYTDAAGCVNLAKSLQTLGINDPKKIVSAPLCLNGQVIQGFGDFPHWTYLIASSLYGDPSDPGMPAYMAVAKKYSTPANAPDPWNIVDFGQLLTTFKIMNEVGYANLSPSAIQAKAKAFTGPQALGAPSLACGKYQNAPGVCNDRSQFFDLHRRRDTEQAAVGQDGRLAAAAVLIDGLTAPRPRDEGNLVPRPRRRPTHGPSGLQSEKRALREISAPTPSRNSRWNRSCCSSSSASAPER